MGSALDDRATLVSAREDRMDSIQDVADKTERLAAYVQRVRGSDWTVTAAQGPQDMCIRLESAAASGASTATPTEFCGNTFDDAEAKLRHYLATNPRDQIFGI
jgi:hypothetical protein